MKNADKLDRTDQNGTSLALAGKIYIGKAG